MTVPLELGPSTVVGIGLAGAGLLLYVLRTGHPRVSRDYDLFFSSVGLLCGGILIFQGWRLDPILLLCQFLSSGTAIFFVGESLWLRSANPEPAAGPVYGRRAHPSWTRDALSRLPSASAMQACVPLAQTRLRPGVSAIASTAHYDYTAPIDRDWESESRCTGS